MENINPIYHDMVLTNSKGIQILFMLIRVLLAQKLYGKRPNWGGDVLVTMIDLMDLCNSQGWQHKRSSDYRSYFDHQNEFNQLRRVVFNQLRAMFTVLTHDVIQCSLNVILSPIVFVDLGLLSGGLKNIRPLRDALKDLSPGWTKLCRMWHLFNLLEGKL